MAGGARPIYRPGAAGGVRDPPGKAPRRTRGAKPAAVAGGETGDGSAGVPAHAAPFVRQPRPGIERRSARGAGNARTRQHLHHADLHPSRLPASCERVRQGPSARAKENHGMNDVRYYSMRRLSPYQGTVQVAETTGFRAITSDGMTWRVQFLNQRSRLSSHAVWRADGSGNLAGTERTREFIAAMQNHPPFPFVPADNLELWLLDAREQKPLAILKRLNYF